MKISPLALQIQKYYANTLARQTSANIRSWRRTRELSFCLLSLPLCSPGAGTNEKTQLSPLGRETHSNKAWEQSQAARSLRQCLGSLSWAPCTGPGLGNCGKKQGHSWQPKVHESQASTWMVEGLYELREHERVNGGHERMGRLMGESWLGGCLGLKNIGYKVRPGWVWRMSLWL